MTKKDSKKSVHQLYGGKGYPWSAYQKTMRVRGILAEVSPPQPVLFIRPTTHPINAAHRRLLKDLSTKKKGR